MVRNLNYRPVEIIASWKLIEPLGKGGNAEVWKATDGDSPVAIKILNSRNVNSESYKRFQVEVSLLKSLGERPGVLNLIEASLPDNPTKQNPAWLIMPIATPIAVALGEKPNLESVVEAVAHIANTLAKLAEEGISHRDIKPSNIYKRDDQWVVGDFGLADYPDKDPITEEGRTLGPRYFIAPEMISNPRDADGAEADVYSLAKTLWVLATGQNFPPQGEQRLDTPQVGIRAYVAHLKSRYLDWLIERATRLNPEDRPTMAEMASELRSWLAPTQKVNSPDDVSDIALHIAIRTEPSSSANRRKELLIEEASTYLEQFREVIEKVASAFVSTSLSNGEIINDAHFLQGSIIYGRELSRVREDHREAPFYLIWYDGLKVTAITPTQSHWNSKPIEIVSGVTVNLYEDKEFEIVVGYDFNFMHGIPRDLPIKNFITWDRAPIGSVKIENFIPKLKNHLLNNLRPALEYYAKLIEVLPFS